MTYGLIELLHERGTCVGGATGIVEAAPPFLLQSQVTGTWPVGC